MQAHKVSLPVFEGPFDLLLFLIRKNEIDIYDIPIASLIRQYLDYIELIRQIDLDYAAEFIDMSATLMAIKAKMLLPLQQSLLDDDLPPDDPRSELVRQLLLYKQFKDISADLQTLQEVQQTRHGRGYFSEKTETLEIPRDQVEDILEDVTLFDLLMAYKSVLENMPRMTTHVIESYIVTIEEQKQFIWELFKKAKRIKFSTVLRSVKEKIVAIVTLLAVLEMSKNGDIRLQQDSVFGEIELHLVEATT
jgi:segregation and condensation protein A